MKSIFTTVPRSDRHSKKLLIRKHSLKVEGEDVKWIKAGKCKFFYIKGYINKTRNVFLTFMHPFIE